MSRLRGHFETPGTLVPSSRPRPLLERVGITFNSLALFILGVIVYVLVIAFFMLVILSALEYADSGRVSSRAVQALIRVIVNLLPWSG